MHFMRGYFRPVELIKGHSCNFVRAKEGPEDDIQAVAISH